MIRSKDMHQVATYWAPGTNDGFGKLSFAGVDPVIVMCRWQPTNTLYRDAQGRELVSDAVVYVASEVEVRGYLALGDFTRDSGAETGSGSSVDPFSIAGAKEIRLVQRSPSLSNDEELIKATI